MAFEAPLRFLALSGSLRAASTNTALLAAARDLAAPNTVVLFDGLDGLPHYNPDLDEVGAHLPETVVRFRALVGASDGLLIACPEYAHGVPGAFKNALDWLVSGPEFPGKPVALFSATTRGAHVHSALVETIRTMSGVMVEEASVSLPLVGKTLTAANLATDAGTARLIQARLAAFAATIRQIRTGALRLFANTPSLS